ncbi:ABC transporter permease [Sulfurimonas hongkongensis]|uniref:ABC transporter permease n=1 Tax=Sulfurimonas hongkongensis TaxID=1172190 RepID=T0JDN6_9BACT|nr:iron ABC transporter permease [Sulfurimonas hongkongensis]EQB39110.1 ABC transporter permease [Sulfurimonas hongkongensis]
MIRFFIWTFLLFVLLVSGFVGAIYLDFSEVFKNDTLAHSIFFELRLPRVIFAFAAGAILSLCGLLYQSLFRNALMTPYTLGVSSGAILGAGIAIKLGLGSLAFGIASISLFGFFGAMLSVLLLLYLARFLKHSHFESLLLLGIALSLFYTSALMIIFYLGSALQNDMLLRFSMGSLSIIGWVHPVTLSIIAIFLFVSIFAYRHELQLLSISDEGAKLRGVDTKKVTLLLLLISSFAIGVLVSVSGPIGFVGLIVPHIVAKLYKEPINKRITKTALFGGFFLVFCDTITRAIPSQSELPIGIITALIGGPFFIYLIISRSKG